MEASKHMIVKPTFKNFKHLIEWSATEDYTYSRNDCMTFPLMWHDLRFGTDKAVGIQDKYNSDFSAKRFLKNYVKPSTWLTSNGYKEVKGKSEDHDIWVVEIEGWPMIWVYYQGHLYFRDHKKLIKVMPKSVKATNKWRK